MLRNVVRKENAAQDKFLLNFLTNLPDTQTVAKEWHGQKTRMGLPRARWIATGAIILFVALTLNRASDHFSSNQAFLPAVLTLAASSFALAAFLLFQEFLGGGKGRVAILGSAYVYGAILIGANGVAYPGVVDARGIIGGQFNSAPALWGAWHIGFPLLIVAAFAFGSAAQRFTITQRDRRQLLAICLATPVTLASAVIVFVAANPSILPGSMHGDSYASISHGGQMIVIGIGAIAALISVWKTRGERTIESWVSVGAVASLADSVLALSGQGRYSFGWAVSHLFGAAAGGIVIAGLLVGIARLYRQAEQDKRALEDEALNLLKETRAAKYREERFRRIIENAADAYIEVDQAGIVQAWNGKATDMFGWRSDEAVGSNFAPLLMAEAGQSQLLAFIEDFWGDEDRFNGARAEIIAMNREMVEFPVEVTMWVDESDFRPQMNFFLRDISVRRQADEQLQRALEDERQAVLRLQELDRAKNDFVSSVSHELRSPLTSTLGFLELLAEGDAGELTSEQLRMVDIASRNAKRLFGLIEDLLTLSRIEENAFRVSFRPVRIEPLIETIVNHNTLIASERGVHLTLDIQDKLGVCPGDEQQLTRALDNIVGNAVKFTPPTGEVTVAVRREHEEVVITVTDTGIGIPTEEQPHLFNRFFRASVAIEQQHTGTGLGLTIAKAIIDHHGGSIEVNSELGRGTTVVVRCPALPVDDTITLSSSAQ